MQQVGLTANAEVQPHHVLRITTLCLIGILLGGIVLGLDSQVSALRLEERFANNFAYSVSALRFYGALVILLGWTAVAPLLSRRGRQMHSDTSVLPDGRRIYISYLASTGMALGLPILYFTGAWLLGFTRSDYGGGFSSTWYFPVFLLHFFVFYWSIWFFFTLTSSARTAASFFVLFWISSLFLRAWLTPLFVGYIDHIEMYDQILGFLTVLLACCMFYLYLSMRRFEIDRRFFKLINLAIILLPLVVYFRMVMAKESYGPGWTIANRGPDYGIPLYSPLLLACLLTFVRSRFRKRASPPTATRSRPHKLED